MRASFPVRIPVLLALLASQDLISSAFPIIQSAGFSNSLRSCNPSDPLRALSALEDISPEHIEDSDDPNFQFSKSKWKKKRFLMIKDVNAAVSKKQPKAATKAEEMIRRMWTLYERTGETEFQPDLQCYNLWIHAVAKTKQRRIEDGEVPIGKKAEMILEEMRERGIPPDIVSYTNVADAYANQARFGDTKAPAEAERILFDLLERSEYTPNLQVTEVTQSTILNAWAQQGTWEGAVRAEQILERLEAIASASTSKTISARLKPTAHSYATVIHAWAISGGGAEAARKANAILDRLLSDKKSAKDSVRPDTVIFNAVINAWANSGDPESGMKAVQILSQMNELSKGVHHDCQPDVVTYNAVLSALSRSGHVNAAVQAEKILKDMILARKEDPDSNPAPNVISYNTVLNAWSKSTLDGAQDRAETLLKFMARTDQKGIVPDVYSYSSVLNAIAKSKTPGKALRAKNLLEHMLNDSPEIKHSELTPVSFNAVINAAAFSALGTSYEERREALEVAVTTFSLMRKLNVSPDAISYGNLLKAFANLMPSGQARYDMAIQLFMDCCSAGLVEDLAWNEVQRCVPFRFLREQLDLDTEHSPVRLRDLPRAWRRNTRAKSRRRQHIGATPDNNIGGIPGSGAPLRRQVMVSEPSYQSGRDV